MQGADLSLRMVRLGLDRFGVGFWLGLRRACGIFSTARVLSRIPLIIRTMRDRARAMRPARYVGPAGKERF